MQPATYGESAARRKLSPERMGATSPPAIFSAPAPYYGPTTTLARDTAIYGTAPVTTTNLARDNRNYGLSPLRTTSTVVSETAPYIASDVVNYGTSPATATTGLTGTPMTPVFSAAYDAGDSLLKSCTFEFFGTLALFFVVVLCGCASYFYIAFFYVALIYAFWFISGAHLNPAISFAMLLARKMPLKTFLGYIVSQIMAGVIGGLLFRCIFYGTKLTVSVVPASSYTLTDALVVQIVYTAMLTLVTLNVPRTDDRNQFYGVAIGFVILAGGSAACAISKGALFNPALCVGLMVSSFDIGSCLWYVLLELVGAIVGVGLFHFCEYLNGFPSGVSNFHGGWFSEFLGTFWFVFTVCLNVGLDTGYSALSGGGALVSAIYVLGGCFNPVLTLALTFSDRGRLSMKHCFGDIVVQLVSAILAGILAGAISKSTGLYTASSSYGWLPIGFVEFLFTLVLAYVALVVINNAHFSSNYYHALVIGFAFFGLSDAASSISGGYLNPALALGFAVDGRPKSSSFLGFVEYYLTVFYYWIPEVIGACVAVLLCDWIYKDRYRGESLAPMHSTPVVGAFAEPIGFAAESMLQRLPVTTGSISSKTFGSIPSVYP